MGAVRPTWTAEHPALCSLRRQVCVHAPDHRLAPELAGTLTDLERVAFVLSSVLDWPTPLPDSPLGGSPAFDVYLVPQASDLTVLPDPPTDTGFVDQSSAFAAVRSGLPDGCYRAYTLAQAFTRAALYGVDVAADDVLANATAAYVASVVEPCMVAYGAAVDDFQLHPDRAISQPVGPNDRGGMLFPWYLQETKGHGGPVDLLHALWVASEQPPPKNLALVANEPDFLDTAESVSRPRPFADLLLDFAVARAFTGSRDDGLHFPTSRMLGSFGDIRFEWSVPYSSLPRRLAPARNVEPSGSSFLWLDLEGVSADAGLSVRARWETPDVFRFAFVLVDGRGVALSRHDPVSPDRGNELQWNLEHLNGAAGMVVVVANTGPTYKDIAFDPDHRPYTARSYTVELFPR